MRRRLLNLLTALSLLLCVSVAMVWVQTHAAGRDLLTASVRGECFTIRSAGSRAVVVGPPAGPRSAPARNESVTWYVHQSVPEPSPLWWFPPPFSTAASFTTSGATPSQRQLLSDLQHPDRFVAAHLMLACGGPTPGPPGDPASNRAHGDMALQMRASGTMDVFHRADDRCQATIDGLTVVLSPTQRRGVGNYQHGRTVILLRRGMESDPDGRNRIILVPASAEVDAAQFPAIREQWQRRLAGPRWSMPYWPLVAASSLLPAARSAAFFRRQLQLRSEKRRGLCRNCGYDLRATPGRCPECGTEPLP